MNVRSLPMFLATEACITNIRIDTRDALAKTFPPQGGKSFRADTTSCLQSYFTDKKFKVVLSHLYTDHAKKNNLSPRTTQKNFDLVFEDAELKIEEAYKAQDAAYRDKLNIKDPEDKN